MKKERYRQFYEKLTAGLRKRPRLVKALVFLDRALVYGFMAAYVVYLGFTLFSRPFEPLYVANKVGLPALCFAAVTLLRLLIKRPRPYEKTGAGIDAIAKKTATGNSMPSRHVASAFVIAMVLIAEHTLIGGLALAAGTLLAVLRFFEGVHYPTDLLAGGALGALFGAVGLFF
jgi:membrane-associated phospholipid phosphatase